MIDLAKEGRSRSTPSAPTASCSTSRRPPTRRASPVDQIRAYDIARGALNPDPVVDKGGGAEAMTGTPVARVRSADGSAVYTVYEGPEHPFVHAPPDRHADLDLRRSAGSPAPTATGGWTIELSKNGRVLTATSERLSKTFTMDVTDHFPALRA